MNTEPPFLERIGAYQSFMRKEAYKPATIAVYSKIVRHFLEWQPTQQETSVESLMREYVNPRRHIAGRPKHMKSVAAAIRLYYYYLTGTRLGHTQEKADNKLIEDHLDEYSTYLAEVAGLTESTRMSRRKYVRRLLYHAFPTKFSPSTLSARMVQDFLVTELKHLRPTSKKVVIGVVRSYVRYLRFKGAEVDSGLLTLPLSAPVWSMSSVPKTISEEDIKRIHTSCDQETVVGIRDYAIALCFTELGLRASEVANIMLDDLNWREGKIVIRKTKTHQERTLPLSRPIGEAVVRYLMKARPETAERTLFVRFSHHCGEAMGRQQIRGAMRRAYARAGLPSSITGTHILRHSKAKELYEHGSSLKIIADILGHESIDTTAIYTKVGRADLACVTCPWPVDTAPEVEHD